MKVRNLLCVLLSLFVLSCWVSPIWAKGPSASPTLTEAEKATILQLREEEKLARDVYLEMYEFWGAPIFNNISKSEQQHMDAVKNLITKYGLVDPVTDESVRGGFTDPAFQQLYQELLAKGQASLVGAYEVGVAIEELDIGDLKKMLPINDNADVVRVMSNLLSGSYNHLDAFNSHLP